MLDRIPRYRRTALKEDRVPVFDMKGGRSTAIATYEVDAKSGFSTSEESHG